MSYGYGYNRRQAFFVNLYRNGRIETRDYPDLCGNAGTVLPRVERAVAMMSDAEWIIWAEEEYEDGRTESRQVTLDGLAAAVHRQQAKGTPLTHEAMDEIVERVALRVAEQMQSRQIHLTGGYR